MRFYVPNMEEVKGENDEIKEDASKKVEKAEKGENDEKEDDAEDDGITPAKQFNDKIREFTGLGD
tara:strand:- start:690 stop:884 length:195 start_codon:yes stop_codon:yes gene_type:complete